jgi:subtilisin family serine protease
MSFAIDATDDETRTGNDPLWCWSNPDHRAARRSLERAVRYARSRGALLVASAMNSGRDLAADNDCDVLPAETPGVVAVSALDPNGVLTSYSNYGTSAVALTAPGGNFLYTCWPAPGPLCRAQPAEDLPPYENECPGIVTTAPGNAYVCGSGTSFAAPHVSGVAALIVSQYGTVGQDGGMKMSPSDVEEILLNAAVDIGVEGEDACYGRGRVDALRSVSRDQTKLYESGADCPY